MLLAAAAWRSRISIRLATECVCDNGLIAESPFASQFSSNDNPRPRVTVCHHTRPTTKMMVARATYE